jgi:hypothetical protein
MTTRNRVFARATAATPRSVASLSEFGMSG